MSTRGKGDSEADCEEQSTGLPGLRSWRQVYGAVFAGFVICVLLLTLLTWVYS